MKGGTNLSGSKQGLVAGYCKLGIEHSVSINGGEFILVRLPFLWDMTPRRCLNRFEKTEWAHYQGSKCSRLLG